MRSNLMLGIALVDANRLHKYIGLLASRRSVCSLMIASNSILFRIRHVAQNPREFSSLDYTARILAPFGVLPAFVDLDMKCPCPRLMFENMAATRYDLRCDLALR